MSNFRRSCQKMSFWDLFQVNCATLKGPLIILKFYRMFLWLKRNNMADAEQDQTTFHFLGGNRYTLVDSIFNICYTASKIRFNLSKTPTDDKMAYYYKLWISKSFFTCYCENYIVLIIESVFWYQELQLKLKLLPCKLYNNCDI